MTFLIRPRHQECSSLSLSTFLDCSLSLVFVAQLDPASQIVICFLFAQPLGCKLLSVNVATNYSAAAVEWNHFYLGKNL